MLHVGHIRVIQAAAALGDRLIVGVSTDELILEYKGRKPSDPYDERRELVSAIKGVDLVVPQRSSDKFAVWERLKFDHLGRRRRLVRFGEVSGLPHPARSGRRRLRVPAVHRGRLDDTAASRHRRVANAAGGAA